MSSAASEATGRAAALGSDAAVLCAAGLVVAPAGNRAARHTMAAVRMAQLLVVATARNAGAWPLQRNGQDADLTRLLCGGAVAVVTLALLTALAPTRPWACEGGSDVLR